MWKLTENTEIIIYQISGKFHFLKLTETFVKVLIINIKLPLKNKVIKNQREIPLTNGSFWKIMENTARGHGSFF